jgi:hypothetical protein
MRDWQEPHESPTGVIRHAASRLLKVSQPACRGRRGAELHAALAHFYHGARRIVFRTRGVVLISRPKSGRTWLRVMLDNLGIHIQYTHVPGKLEKPRDLEARLIQLHRDPRDTLVSAWYHNRKRGKGHRAGELADFLRDPEFGFEQILRFNLFWAEQVTRNGGCVTSYERLQQDTGAELNRIVRFIKGHALDDATIAQAIAAGSFARMRDLEASGEGAKLYGFTLMPGDPDDPESYKTRQGKIGAWQAHFTETEAAFAGELLDKHGYFERLRKFTA